MSQISASAAAGNLKPSRSMTMDDLANLELRVACIEEWIVQTTKLA